MPFKDMVNVGAGVQYTASGAGNTSQSDPDLGHDGNWTTWIGGDGSAGGSGGVSSNGTFYAEWTNPVTIYSVMYGFQLGEWGGGNGSWNWQVYLYYTYEETPGWQEIISGTGNGHLVSSAHLRGPVEITGTWIGVTGAKATCAASHSSGEADFCSSHIHDLQAWAIQYGAFAGIG